MTNERILIMKSKKTIGLLLVLFAAVFGIAVLFLPSFGEKASEVKYREFYQMVEQGEVTVAEISEDTVFFRQKDGEELYETENPQKDDFREFLLLHDVEVETEASAADILYLFL